jgi:hypothetical protein
MVKPLCERMPQTATEPGSEMIKVSAHALSVTRGCLRMNDHFAPIPLKKATNWPSVLVARVGSLVLKRASEQAAGLVSPAFGGSGPWQRGGTRPERLMDLSA